MAILFAVGCSKSSHTASPAAAPKPPAVDDLAAAPAALPDPEPVPYTSPLSLQIISTYKKEVGLSEKALKARRAGLKCKETGDNQMGAAWGRLCTARTGQFEADYQITKGVVSFIQITPINDKLTLPVRQNFDASFGQATEVQIGYGCFGQGKPALAWSLDDVVLVTNDPLQYGYPTPPSKTLSVTDPVFEIILVPASAIIRGHVPSPYYCEG